MSIRIFLVTGAAGHLGSNLVNELLKRKEKVRAFVFHNDKMKIQDKNLEVFEGDVRDKESLIRLFNGLKNYEIYLVHCAGIVTIASKFDQNVYDVNVKGTKNIVDLCSLYKVKKLVHVSSVHAIEEKAKGEVITEVSHFDPEIVTGLYAKTKAEATEYVLQKTNSGLDASVVHPSGIIGPGNNGKGHLSQLIIDFMNHKLTAIVKGGYDFVDVRDVVNGIITCAFKGRKGECYILSNKYFSVKEIMDLLHEVTGRKKIKTILPSWFAKFTAPLAELYYKILKSPPLYTSYSLYTLSSNSLFSHEKATRELNYHPRNMKDTLKDTADWLIKEGRIK